jgi:hypothetical protein
MEVVLGSLCESNGLPRFVELESGKRRSRSVSNMLKELISRKALPKQSSRAAKNILHGAGGRQTGEPRRLCEQGEDGA